MIFPKIYLLIYFSQKNKREISLVFLKTLSSLTEVVKKSYELAICRFYSKIKPL